MTFLENIFVDLQLRYVSLWPDGQEEPYRLCSGVIFGYEYGLDVHDEFTFFIRSSRSILHTSNFQLSAF